MKPKKFLLFLVVLACIFAVKASWANEGQSSGDHWYQIFVATYDPIHQVSYLGSSNCSESEMAELISSQTPVFLRNLVAVDSLGKRKPITDTVPFSDKSIYINPKYIVSVFPLKGDPRGKSN